MELAPDHKKVGIREYKYWVFMLSWGGEECFRYDTKDEIHEDEKW